MTPCISSVVEDDGRPAVRVIFRRGVLLGLRTTISGQLPSVAPDIWRLTPSAGERPKERRCCAGVGYDTSSPQNGAAQQPAVG